MKKHQEQQPQQEDQETMVSQKNPNLETTHNHHHQLLPPPPSSSQDFKNTHHHQNIQIPKKTNEDKVFIFKNDNYEVMIKKPNFLSSSSTTPAAGEGYPIQQPPPLPPPPPPLPQDFKKIHLQHDTRVSKKINGNEEFSIINMTDSLSWPSSAAAGEVGEVEESGRDRLKKHRVEMAGRVRIPDIWGHEDLLKDWIDCTVFDSSLGNKTIMSARAALVQERRSTLSIQNQC